MTPKPLKYIEFGRFLRRWREPYFRTAKAMYSAGRSAEKISFSYDMYSSYERGEDLPPMKYLEEIAAFLKLDLLIAIPSWVSQQIHSPELKEQWLSLGWDTGTDKRTLRATRPYSISSNSIPPREFDNTWVFAAPERKAIEANPWLINFFIGLGMTYPESVAFDSMGLTDQTSIDYFVSTHLKRWLEDERIALTDDGVKLMKRYFHIPKNEEWQQIRKKMIESALTDILPRLTPSALEAKQCHRTLTTRFKTEEERLAIIESIARVESEFFSTPYPGEGGKEPGESYTLIMLLAPRSFQLSDEVRRPSKTK